MNERKTVPLTRTLTVTPSVFRNWRERFIVPLLLGTLAFGLLALVPALISARSMVLDVIFAGVYLSVLLVTLIRLPYLLRTVVFLSALFVLGLTELFTTGILGDGLFFFLGFIVFATMLLSPLAGVIATAITLLTCAITAWLTLSSSIELLNSSAMVANPQDWLSASASTLLLSAAIIFGFRRLQLEFDEAQNKVSLTVHELDKERSNLEQNVQARTAQLRKINEIGRAVSALLDPDDLYARITHLIGEQFNCYYTALYLLDPTSRWAELVEATGEAGHVLKVNRHRLEVGSKNLISQAIRDKTAQIVTASFGGALKTDNPLLPYTRSEITLPLLIGDRVIGALDLHSSRESSFIDSDIDTLQNMANQIAVSLENARSYALAEKSIQEMNAVQRQYVQSAWTSLTRENPVEFRLGDTEVSDSMKEINVPLSLRDQIIGQISMASEGEWTPEQRSMIESIAAQAALALENARLVEESQATATHERLAVDITSKVWASTSMEAILQTTVRELGRALGASEATIELEVGSNDG